MKPDLFKTDIRSIIGQSEEIDVVFEDRIKDVVTSDDKTTKDIGNLGEAIICGHEKMRLKINGYDEFVKLVQIVDSPTYHPGFDIDSFEADGTENHRYIEVKTTISKKRIQMYGFHMSPNEWRVANTIREHYCVYRLMLSEKRKYFSSFAILLHYIKVTELKRILAMAWKYHSPRNIFNLQKYCHGKDKSRFVILWMWWHGFRSHRRLFLISGKSIKKILSKLSMLLTTMNTAQNIQ